MREIFVTGATGTIGSALVPRLLRSPDTRVRLLVRARDDADLQRRMASMRAYWGWDEDDERGRRVVALRGDICAPGLGLAPAEHAAVAAECSHLVHCAASVNLLMPIEQARATAVAPTRAVLELGRLAASAGVLRKIDLVSTVGVWGRTPGTMPERPLPEVERFHNTYEAAKAEAERVVWNEGADLPITVHRPSMVVGESDSGRVIHFQVFYHLCEFLSGVRTRGIVPTLGAMRLDVIPVDWVAAAIDWASRNEDTAGSIFHLCSGPEGAIALGPLQATVRERWQRQGRTLPPLRTVSRRLLQHAVPVLGAFAGAKARRALRALPPVLEYLGEDQSFANVDTARRLAGAGLPVPPAASYLGPVLDYYLARRAAEARR